MHPIDHMSTSCPYPFLVSTSGAIYERVPQLSNCLSVGSKILERPKSVILTLMFYQELKFLSTRMFAGLRSLWAMPQSFRYWIPFTNWYITEATCDSLMSWFPMALDRSPSLAYSITMWTSVSDSNTSFISTMLGCETVLTMSISSRNRSLSFLEMSVLSMILTAATSCVLMFLHWYTVEKRPWPSGLPWL